MEIVSSVWHVISASLVFIIGLLICFSLSRPFQIKRLMALCIYFWHTVMCLVYVWYAQRSPADANRYFNSELDFANFKLGTQAVETLTNLLKLLDLSYLGCFLVFNIIGTIGLLAFSASLQHVTKQSSSFLKWLAIIFTFLPSVSFWSSAIGKDAISFFATGMLLWSVLDLKHRKSLLIVSVFSMLIVRPHMAGIMMIAISSAIVMDKNVNIQVKSLFAVASLSILVFLVPYALNYAGVTGDISSANVDNYLAKKQGHNMEGGSSVNIASMPLPVKMFTYLFRPLPHEAHNITALLASLDNVMILILFALAIKHVRSNQLKADQANRLLMWSYSLGCLLILSLTTANLGIAMRQKWMFLPIIIYLLLSSLVFTRRKHRMNSMHSRHE